MKVAAIIAGVAVLAATADAHSKMALPKPTWNPVWGTNSPSGTIDGPKALTVPGGMSFGTDPTSNTKAFTAAFKAQTKYKSLKDLVFATQTVESGTTKECGFSLVSGTPQPLPDVVEWDELTPSHEGPCEIWCDNKLAFSNENCAKNYPGTPAKLPYDKSKCTGAKMLTSIWLALHTPTWQVYTNCAPLSGASSSGEASSTSKPTAAPVTETPQAGADDEYATPAPALTKKCKAKTRKLTAHKKIDDKTKRNLTVRKKLDDKTKRNLTVRKKIDDKTKRNLTVRKKLDDKTKRNLTVRKKLDDKIRKKEDPHV
uniref:Uncharacterized protein n=1 Tax=Globisporangium ultimum (strain ATCC 200006 / CBS 805.95 / DAOM BR144) TaxID=431595 RepID=K3W984_GLOUD